MQEENIETSTDLKQYILEKKYSNKLFQALNSVAENNAKNNRKKINSVMAQIRIEIFNSGISKSMLFRYSNNRIQPTVETANTIFEILKKYEPSINYSDIF